jgi:putative endonuclease
MSGVAKLLRRFLGRGGDDKPSPRSALVGAWGEERAAAFLKAKGFTIVGRNVRPNKRDEIDIVARVGETLVFVEVKARRREDFGRPLMAVDKAKRHALNRAAAAYLRKAKYPNLFYRFDVVEVLGQPDEGEPDIRHLDDAFPFERRFKFPV